MQEEIKLTLPVDIHMVVKFNSLILKKKIPKGSIVYCGLGGFHRARCWI